MIEPRIVFILKTFLRRLYVEILFEIFGHVFYSLIRNLLERERDREKDFAVTILLLTQ